MQTLKQLIMTLEVEEAKMAYIKAKEAKFKADRAETKALIAWEEAHQKALKEEKETSKL